MVEPVFVAHFLQTSTILPSPPPDSPFSDPTGPWCDSPTQPAAEHKTRMHPFNRIGLSRRRYPAETYQRTAKPMCYFDACGHIRCLGNAGGPLSLLSSPRMPCAVERELVCSIPEPSGVQKVLCGKPEGGRRLQSCRVVWTRHLPALQPVQQEKAMDKLPTLPQTPFDLP